ncbi:MAG: alanine--tRNA ligase, partial [Spirochaetes bacterium]|nr:alanine--tRNA ligase [Spirochaetota bacterium]
FYAESGGQTSDKGRIYNQEFEFQVSDTQKHANYIFHIGKLNYGVIKKGDKVIAQVDTVLRAATMKNHTATHLLQAALKKVIGDHIVQAGSFVSPDRLRFDFRHYEAIQADKLREIEEVVNGEIQKNTSIEKYTKEKDEAIKMGATAIFGEKYGEKVRVVKINDFSMELCGGTHIDSTGEIGLFLILSEMSIASGIRRIEAITGKKALDHIQKTRKDLDELKNILKVSDDNMISRIRQLLETNKELEKRLNSSKFNNINDLTKDLKSSALEKDGSKLILHIFEDEDNKFVSNIGDSLIKELNSGIILFFNSNKEEDKFSVLLLVTEDLIKKGINAKKTINTIGALFNGSGGGRDDRAQAGGKDCSSLNNILKKSKELILNLI